MYSRCPNVIFQTLPSSSRLMTSHHVTFLSHAFFIILQKKIKEKKSKIRKIKEKRIKIVSIRMFHNTTPKIFSFLYRSLPILLSFSFPYLLLFPLSHSFSLFLYSYLFYLLPLLIYSFLFFSFFPFLLIFLIPFSTQSIIIFFSLSFYYFQCGF